VGVCGNCATGAGIQHTADDGFSNSRDVEHDIVYWCGDWVDSSVGSEMDERMSSLVREIKKLS